MSESESLQSALGASGSEGGLPEIHYKGKVWRVGHPTQSAKKTLEALVVASAWAEVRELKEVLPPDSYKELADTMVAKIASKHYKTWGGGWQEVALGSQGAPLFFLSLLRELHPNATLTDAITLTTDCSDEVKIALAEVTPRFLELLVDELKERGVSKEKRDELKKQITEKLAEQLPKINPPQPLHTP